MSARGANVSTKVGETLQTIHEKATKVSDLVAQMAAANAEQNDSLRQLGDAMAQMDKITQAGAANSEETAAAAQQMNAQARDLLEAVAALDVLVGHGAGEGGAIAVSSRATARETEAPTREERALRVVS